MPFEIPTGFYAVQAVPEGQGSESFGDFYGGPCPRCWGEGEEAYGPVFTSQTISEDGRIVAVAGNQSSALKAYLEITNLLADDRITVPEAADRLRRESPAGTAIADRLESHPVTTAAAAAILTALLSFGGPAVIDALNAPDPQSPAIEPGISPEELKVILDAAVDQQASESGNPRRGRTSRSKSSPR